MSKMVVRSGDAASLERLMPRRCISFWPSTKTESAVALTSCRSAFPYCRLWAVLRTGSPHP